MCPHSRWRCDHNDDNRFCMCIGCSIKGIQSRRTKQLCRTLCLLCGRISLTIGLTWAAAFTWMQIAWTRYALASFAYSSVAARENGSITYSCFNILFGKMPQIFVARTKTEKTIVPPANVYFMQSVHRSNFIVRRMTAESQTGKQISQGVFARSPDFSSHWRATTTATMSFCYGNSIRHGRTHGKRVAQR